MPLTDLGRLLLKVHQRHVMSVPSGHGLAFEELLRQCGLIPEQVALEIDMNGSQDTSHLKRAVDSQFSANDLLFNWFVNGGRLVKFLPHQPPGYKTRNATKLNTRKDQPCRKHLPTLTRTQKRLHRP